jgi:cyanate permease
MIMTGMLEPSALLHDEIGPYAMLMLICYLDGIFGHVMRSRWIVVIGVIMIFLATLLFPLAIHLFEDRPAPPAGPQLEP